MRNRKDTKIVLYTENEDGLFDELTVDIYNQDFEYVSNCEEKHLGVTSGKSLKEFHVEGEFFNALHNVLKCNYSGSYSDADDYIDEEQHEREESKKPIIAKEKIWQAIRWAVDEKELARIISFDYRYEDDDYYDFDLIIEKIHALMRGEKTIRYFTGWCIVLMRCFMDNMDCKSKELLELFYDLGDFFDAVAFMDTTLKGEKKLKECRETIAKIKHYNHLICDLKNNSETDFTTNKVITYVTFAFSLNDGTECLYKFCIVDKKKKTINYLYAPEIDYSEEINYTFLSQAEFEDLSSKYYDNYTLDASMEIDYALKCRKRKNQR